MRLYRRWPERTSASRESHSRQTPASPTSGTLCGKFGARESFFLPIFRMGLWRGAAIGCPISRALCARSSNILPLVLPFFKHVLNRGLVDHQIRLALLPVHLDAVPVVPLDDPAPFLAVAQHDHHRRPRLHLLPIIKILGVGLLRRRQLFSRAACHCAIPSVSSIHAFSAILPLRPFAPFR